LATSTHDGTSFKDDGVVEWHWWQPTTAMPPFRTLHALDGVASSAQWPPVQLRFTAMTVGCGDKPLQWLPANQSTRHTVNSSHH